MLLQTRRGVIINEGKMLHVVSPVYAVACVELAVAGTAVVGH